MAEDDKGWIRVHRNSFNNPLYFSEPFTKWQAWTDMLLLANHKPGFFFRRGVKVDVPRGSVGYSVEELCNRWKWSRGKAERFFVFLESNPIRQIVRQKTNVTTLISILNYERYQSDGKANDNTNSKANGQQTVKQTDTNKNVKNVKNENNEEIEKKETGSFSPAPSNFSGYNYLPDGRSYIDREVFYTAADFNGLPTDKNDAIRQNLSIVKQVVRTEQEVAALWEVFKTMNLTFQKPYRNHDDVYNHFSNWVSGRSFSKAKKESERAKTEKKQAVKEEPKAFDLRTLKMD